MQIGVAAVLAFVGALVMLYLLGKLLAWPAKKLGKLILNGVLGGLLLMLLNFVGGFIGIRLAINPLTALVAGTFGVPGIALLLLLPALLT